MAFRRSRTGASLRAERRSTMSDFNFSLREVALLPMISLISRDFWERVKRSVGFSARGSKGQTPLSGSLLRAGLPATAATAAVTAVLAWASTGATGVLLVAGTPFVAGMAL